MPNVINLNTPFAETSPAENENRIKLFTSTAKDRVIAAIEYVQHFEENNPAHNFKCAEFESCEQLRSGLEANTLLGKLKTADIICIDEIYDLRDTETPQVVTALQEALHDGKLVVLSGDPVNMEKFMSAHGELKAEAASLLRKHRHKLPAKHHQHKPVAAASRRK